MVRQWRYCFGAALFFGAHSCLAARWALLIGNDKYQNAPVLINAKADAHSMAMAFERAGYKVVLQSNRTQKQMLDDVRDLRQRVQGGDEVVFFYSGHGVQMDGLNYLLPVDVRSETQDQVKDDSLSLSRILEDIRAQKPAFTLAIIDACRNNPFTQSGKRSIGGARGLAGVSGATGQMVIYSAGEGQQALDRLSEKDPVRNGLFTRVFIQEMERPGVPITDVVRNVREEVFKLAQTIPHEQVPAIYDQALGKFYFYTMASSAVAPKVDQYANSMPSRIDAMTQGYARTPSDLDRQSDISKQRPSLESSSEGERIAALDRELSEESDRMRAISARRQSPEDNNLTDLRIFGMRLSDLDATQRRQTGVDSGAYVLAVTTGSSAQRAGILQGDVITRWGGQRVRNIRNLKDASKDERPRTMVSVLRNELSLDFELER